MPRRALANLPVFSSLASLPAPKTRYETGPCPHCGLALLVDHARDAISHAEPVCREFETAAMRANLGSRGRPDTLRPDLGCLVPDLEAMKRERDRS